MRLDAVGSAAALSEMPQQHVGGTLVAQQVAYRLLIEALRLHQGNRRIIVQLGTYLRDLRVPVPGTYVTSADGV